MTVWIIFLIAISIFLALDLGVFNKNPHIISSKEASKWTVLWVTLSFIFSGIVYLLYAGNYIDNPTNLRPAQASLKYITGYLIELSLSADNIFVIAIISPKTGPEIVGDTFPNSSNVSGSRLLHQNGPPTYGHPQPFTAAKWGKP